MTATRICVPTCRQLYRVQCLLQRRRNSKDCSIPKYRGWPIAPAHIWRKEKDLIPIETSLNAAFGLLLRGLASCHLPQRRGDRVVRVPKLSCPCVGDPRQRTPAWGPPIRGEDWLPNHQHPDFSVRVSRQDLLYCGGPPQARWSSRRKEQDHVCNICIGVKSGFKLAEVCARESD